MGERKGRDGSVLGGLPSSRPERRSPKRSPTTPPIAQPAQPAGAPPRPAPGVEERRRGHTGDAPARSDRGKGAHPPCLATAVQATGELAAIGASVAGRVVRGALHRLPGR